jgi:hypothetical protein
MMTVFDIQTFEKTDTIRGEISGALHGDASIGTVSHGNDFHFNAISINCMNFISDLS